VALNMFHQFREEFIVADFYKQGFELDLDLDGTGTPSDELQAEASIWAFKIMVL
jgi:hypothetical protein